MARPKSYFNTTLIFFDGKKCKYKYIEYNNNNNSIFRERVLYNISMGVYHIYRLHRYRFP